MKDRVAIEMKRYFTTDFKRIGHATRVARYAEELAKKEKGNPAVILSAAYLHDIGIQEAERKYQSTAAQYQEEEGPPIARQILTKLGAREDLIEEVCDIVGHHHHPREKETTNFKAIYDAGPDRQPGGKSEGKGFIPGTIGLDHRPIFFDRQRPGTGH